jgi:hypothetical protein
MSGVGLTKGLQTLDIQCADKVSEMGWTDWLPREYDIYRSDGMAEVRR